MNATLENFGRPKVSDEIIAGYIGNGALMLVRRASDRRRPRTGRRTSHRSLQFSSMYYREHKLDYTYAYEGVLEALKALHQVHDRSRRAVVDALPFLRKAAPFRSLRSTERKSVPRLPTLSDLVRYLARHRIPRGHRHPSPPGLDATMIQFCAAPRRPICSSWEPTGTAGSANGSSRNDARRARGDADLLPVVPLKRDGFG